MCQTTINQSTVIANISVCIAGQYVSTCFELNGVPQVETISKYDLWLATGCIITEIPVNNAIHVVRLWLIEKYK